MIRNHFKTACLALSFVGGAGAVHAEDIDIFLGSSGGSAAAPTVMFLLDNSPNWSRQAQQWPDNGGNQGQAEVTAINSVLASLQTRANVGVAMMVTPNGSTDGGYIRYGARDMTVATNRTALTNILNAVNANITSPNEKLQGQSQKEESASLYELYKYFSGLAPYRGRVSQAPNADAPTNRGYTTTYGTGANNGSTPAGQGLSDNFALNAAGNLYNAPLASGGCGKGYVIYISNNANNSGSDGLQSYESVSAGPAISPSLAYETSQGRSGVWVDEWSRYLYQSGITVYILDAYNRQQNTGYSSVLQRAAKVAGGKYYRVGSQDEITTALTAIFTEIQSVNTAFASASLPVNATNRSQSQNQVFIGSFRPDPDARPRWPGNLKQYQITQSNSSLDLGDQLGNPAIVAGSGYIGDCAVSFWTTDTSSVGPATPNIPYWSDVTSQPVPKSACATPALPVNAPLVTGTISKFSDWPDGGAVEKGGVAEVIRKGNNPPTTQTSPTWLSNSSTRNIYTYFGTSLTAITPASTSNALNQETINWVYGADSNSGSVTTSPEKTSNSATNSRPFVHGDVIHSRPLPLNQPSGVTVYYGANDGLLHAVNGDTGKERWAFMAPDFFSKIGRIFTNSPMVSYPGLSTSTTPTPAPKDYFFDGDIGVYQNADSSKVWIYPSMRRGGRMIYALNVTNPDTPVFKWRFGCTGAADTTCPTVNEQSMGQTWSAPVAARIQGYGSGLTPVVIVGGGYDACEDANNSSPSCSSPKGNAVFVLDADTGTVLRKFSTSRSVAATATLISTTRDGIATHAYIADTGGTVYRIDFVGVSNVARVKDDWSIKTIANTSGGGRKFLFQPSVLPVNNNQNVYVAIGSGDREHPLQSQYPYSSSVTNRFYVFVDSLVSNQATINLDETSTAASLYMSDLTSSNCATAANCSAQAVTPQTPSASPTKIGWFINLNAGRGEQVVTSSVIAGGAVIFSTNRPIDSTTGTCSTALGEARGYYMNLFNSSGVIGTQQAIGGSRSALFAGGGLPPSPVLVTVSVRNADGSSSLKTVVIGAASRQGGASSPLSPQLVTPSIRAKRSIQFWRGAQDDY